MDSLELGNIVSQNREILEFTFFIVILVSLIKFFTNKILTIILFLVVSFNGYYFGVMEQTQKNEVKVYLTKMKETKTADFKNIDILGLLPKDLRERLESQGIRTSGDLIKMLEDYYMKK